MRRSRRGEKRGWVKGMRRRAGKEARTEDGEGDGQGRRRSRGRGEGGEGDTEKEVRPVGTGDRRKDGDILWPQASLGVSQTARGGERRGDLKGAVSRAVRGGASGEKVDGRAQRAKRKWQRPLS
ncbi:hypothetical protein FGB62_416g05 [Gracilaria domingensis]|nr:hypothetical protein FGB62_416g05 [Gracilaria domingensis]